MDRRTFLNTTAASAGLFSLAACGGSDLALADAAQAAPTSPPPAPVTPIASPPSTVAVAVPSSASPPAISNVPASPQIVLPPAVPLPAWVANLPLWQWYEIPGTALASVEPATRPPGITGPSSKIIAWNGACLKRERSVYMLGAAGGHGDYAGNEVNALMLNASAPKWVQLRGPTPSADIINRSQFYLDYRPSAEHTYYSTHFIESLNRMIIVGGGAMNYDALPTPPQGWPYAGTSRWSASFNVSANDWDKPNEPNYPVSLYPGTGDKTACLCVKHPWTEDVYYSRNSGDGWYRWTRATNVWAKASSVSRGYVGAAIDPRRNRMFILGGEGPEVRDLNGTRLSVSFTGLGASALTVSGYPGAIYDEANDCFLAVFNSGGTIRVLKVNPESWLVADPQLTGTPPVARMNGIHNSVQYVPELRGFVLANSYSGNVVFVRTSA